MTCKRAAKDVAAACSCVCPGQAAEIKVKLSVARPCNAGLRHLCWQCPVSEDLLLQVLAQAYSFAEEGHDSRCNDVGGELLPLILLSETVAVIGSHRRLRVC